MEIKLSDVHRLIQTYWRETGKIPKYLVMCNETVKLIENEYDKTFKQVFKRANNLKLRQYYGIDIATCDRLRLGEIEAV